MKITFTGAAREVTGSRHLLEINGKKILLDCGMKQGHRKEADKHNRAIPFDPKELDAVILSHAHIDHCGLLPMLVKNGFDKTIWSTHATRDVAELMLLDSAHIGESDALYWAKKHPHEPAVEPLYYSAEVGDTIELFHGIDYRKPREILPGITLEFHDAGHVLGSAIVTLKFEEDGKKRKLLFTGDLGRPGLPILRDPDKIDETDILITESTYGNRLHEEYEKADDRLSEVINKTAERGGKVIIPSFALERTQELIYTLYLLKKEGRIPKIPIYIDSPLAINLTEVFQNHFECFDEEMKKLWRKHGSNPFGFGDIKYTRTVEESKEIDRSPMPSIIVSASGMCEAGRILHHLANGISNRRNTIMFVGYQAASTLGRRLVEGEKEAKLFGIIHPVKAEIVSMDFFSAHADYLEMLTWMRGMKINEKVFVVHGEESAAMEMAEKIHQEKRFPREEIFIPKEGDTYEV